MVMIRVGLSFTGKTESTYLSSAAGGTSHLALQDGTLGLFASLGRILDGLGLGCELNIADLFGLCNFGKFQRWALSLDGRGCVGVDG